MEVSLYPPTQLGIGLFEDQRVTRMKDAGWCPIDIVAVSQRFSSAQMLYFLSRMRKLEPRRSHADCSSEMCRWNQIKKEDYRTLHTIKGCSCDNVSANIDSFQACLDDDKLALLSLSNTAESSNDVSLEVVPYSGREDFVAISHVWANGLGNPHQNSLPSCQIKYLHSLASSIREISF